MCWLAVRVDSELRVCVSDAALSRDVFPRDYHCLGDNDNRPVGWLAFEALVTRSFSTAADMVSATPSLSLSLFHRRTRASYVYNG